MEINRFSNNFQFPVCNISPQKVTKILLLSISLLIVGHLAEKLVINGLNSVMNLELVPHYFVFDEEANFPSLYSAIILGFCSYLLNIITTIRKSFDRRDTKFWKALSFIFLYMAIDEACSIHELLIPVLRGALNTKGALFFPWVIPAFIFLIIFLIIFKNFIYNLPPKIRTLFIVAGAIYVGGALGMEMVGGYFADVMGFNTKAYWIASTVEELMEMLGIVIFVHGLLCYIKSYSTNLSFSLSLKNEKG
ncbi:MAG: hypothetical protein Tsb0014_03640 [Pleurocapsa sp.]